MFQEGQEVDRQTAPLQHNAKLRYFYTYFYIFLVLVATASKNGRLPSNNGHIFLQQVIPPSLVYWPRDVSSKKTGMPQANRKMRYGMKKAPVIGAVRVNLVFSVD